MQYTPNYELPLYEPSDIANYLETYNNTITEIDNAIHEVQLKAEYGGTQGAEMQKEIESLNTRVTALESSLNTTIENVNTMSTTVSGHTTEIAKLKEDLLAQNTVVKSLSNTISELSAQFSTFKTEQESFNTEISAKVGNRYFKTHKYDIPPADSHSPDNNYRTEFTISTGLANNESFTKSHIMIEFMQLNGYEKKSSATLNCDFSTTTKMFDIGVDTIHYRIDVTFNSNTGDITVVIRGAKLVESGTLYVNTIVYTD